VTKRRNRQQGGGYEASEVHPVTPAGWPSGKRIVAVFEADTAALAALADVTTEDMLAVLQKMPPQQRQFVVHSIGLHSAGSVNRGMASQLLAQMRRQEKLGSGALLRTIVLPLVTLLDSDDLSAEDWANLSGDSGTSAMYTLAEHDEFARRFAQVLGVIPTSLLRAGLVAAISANVASAAVALAFLARDDEHAGKAYTELRRQFPDMPGIPALPFAATGPASRLVDAGVLPPGLGPGPEQIVELLETALENEAARDATPDDNPARSGNAVDDLAFEATALLDDWDASAEKLMHMAARMHEGVLPARDDLASVLSFVDEAGTVLNVANELIQNGDVLEAGRDGLTRAAELLNAQREPSEPDGGWLVELAELSAPSVLEETAGLIRKLAERAIAGDADEGLRAGLRGLHTLIGLTAARRAGIPVDYDAVTAAQSAAVMHLPTETGQLVFAAAVGDLGLPVRSNTDNELSIHTGESAPEELSTHIGPTESSAECSPSETMATDERSEEEPSYDAGMLPDQAAPEIDPLADLDLMLADGAAASLATATGARRTTTAKSARANLEQPDNHQSTAPAGGPEQQNIGTPKLVTDEVEAELLRQSRFGLAADLRQARGGSEAEVGARLLAAYAADLRQATGPLATAFAREAPTLTRETLAADRQGQLVAWAAAVRIAVLSPSAGAAGLIAELSPCVSGHPALTEIGQAFAEASRSGLLVLPEVANAVEALSAVETRAEELARLAAETVSLAPQRSIKYAPANRVYQIWMNSDGLLGELLEMVAKNDSGHLAAVRKLVVDLRGRAPKSIEDIFSSQRRNPHAKIIAGAHTTLISRWDEAIELASRWAETAELAAERTYRLDAGRWQASPLTTLRTRVREFRTEALDELAVIATSSPDGAGEGAARLLIDALSICDGLPPSGDDVEPEFAAHGELLATALQLSPRTLVPDSGLSDTDVGALLTIANARPEWSDVYAARAEAGDHDLTAVLINALQRSEPHVAASLQLRRDADVAEAGAAIAEDVVAVASLVNARRLAGALTDESWSSLSARVAALDDPTRRDFRRMHRELGDIRAKIEDALAAKIHQTITRIEARAADSSTVADAAETLLELTRSGHIASAEEFLEQALTGGSLPTLQSTTDHFARFHPAVPELVMTHPDLLDQLRAAFHGDSPTAPVSKLSELVGVDMTNLPQARRDFGVKAIKGWHSLAGASERGVRIDVTEALRGVLGQAGFEFGELEVHPEVSGQTGRRWITLRKVKGTGTALHPALGSAMSPDGATLRVLLVRRTASPATVVEWMSGEPADHTVLVLWQAGPLSTDGRRAIANAARGRPRPPLLLLDVAALVYLICQLEPRRATFAEIALPFTAISPYRDTPGDVAPEMFYGRTEEMAAVLDLAGSSIVYGGRQLGKSALLRAAERRFRAEGRSRIAVLTSIFTIGADGHAERLWSTLWPKLAAHGVVGRVPPDEGKLAETVYDGILAWLNADSERALLILLDEADAFLDADAAGNAFTNVDWCRRIREDSSRRAKFVFAGLHRTARFESLLNQPLSHFGRPVSVGPLRPQHAYNLLTSPLAALGFRFTDEIAIPARILALTNNMPALLQLFGRALVAYLTNRPVGPGEPPGLVTEADVDAVLSDAELLDAFREKYVLTLNLDHRYLVIAYAVAQAAFEHGIDTTLSFSELVGVCRQAWPEGFASCGVDDLRGLVTECVDLGVLATDAGRYRMRTPMVLRLLGTEEEILEALYSAPERLSMPLISDAGFYRRHLPGTSAHSPLTEAQLGRIFGAHAGVLVVAGSTALSAERVSTALEDAHSERAGRFGQLVQARTLTPDGLRRTIEMLTASRALVIANVRDVKTEMLRDLLWTASDAVSVAEGSNIAASVVLIAGPANAAAWVGREDLVELSRLDPIGLRLWCDEDGLPYHDDAARAEVLAITGGWPKLMSRVAEHQSTAGPISGAEALVELSRWLSSSGVRELPDAAGVGAKGGVLAKTFASVASLTSVNGEDAEYLTELLSLDEAADLVAAAREGGYSSLGEVVEALSVLGCLIAGPNGLLQAERVLATAVTAAIA
jgi:hypothetical protein